MSDANLPERPAPPARTVVVRLRVPSDLAQFDAGELQLVAGDPVVVETERGPMLGVVVLPPETQEPHGNLRPVVRRATDEDQLLHERNLVREREAFAFCRERVQSLGLGMKLVGAELSHTGTRATFHFTSADRVDFRELVRELARRFHTRIEMRQIGVRDAARYVGGQGLCGRELCCSTWLPSFQPISIRMAKDQNLALNQDKLSGLCGRLRCCLRYEQATYEKERAGLPKVGKRVRTPEGEGRVKDVNVLRRRVRVHLQDGRYVEFAATEVERLGGEPQGGTHSGA